MRRRPQPGQRRQFGHHRNRDHRSVLHRVRGGAGWKRVGHVYHREVSTYNNNDRWEFLFSPAALLIMWRFTLYRNK